VYGPPTDHTLPKAHPMTLLQAFLVAVVEGITEFLPVSSTGHMILTEALLRLHSSAFVKTYIVTIQFGAILSVVALYWRRFIQSLRFYALLAIAFLPAAAAGFLLGDVIDRLLESVTVVAAALIIGGIVLTRCDGWFTAREGQTVTWKTALVIGLFQCCALIPGVSRSAATIIGGMSQGLGRKEAAEFSFFLAVPTMLAAAGYKILTAPTSFSRGEMLLLIFGNVIAFIVAALAIRGFVAYLTRKGFRLFGWYRIVVGGIIFLLMACGVELRIF